MLPMAAVARLPEGLRFVVIDASSIQAPGAKGTDHRLHISMDLVSLQCIDVLVSDVHTGETLQHCTLGPGDVALTDRGYAQAQGMSDAVKRGAARFCRKFCSGGAEGAVAPVGAGLKRQGRRTVRPQCDPLFPPRPPAAVS